MRTTRVTLTLLIVWPTCAALAQLPHTTRTLDWLEVVAGSSTLVPNPNGVLDPGEGALIRLWLSFTPSVGSPVTYSFPPPGGVAPVAGFSLALFNVNATGANGGSWTNLTTSPGFTGTLGTLLSEGSLLFARVGQPEPTGGQFPLPTNPLPRVWQAVWTPPDYDPRAVSFELGATGIGATNLFAHIGQGPGGNPLFGQAPSTSTVSQVHIPVVPGPGCAILVLLAIACRRPQRFD